jgi:lipopolysaccharide export system protein LptA
MRKNKSTPHRCAMLVFGACTGSLAQYAVALSSDNDQPMNIEANHQKSIGSASGAANDPAITHLDGNVIIVRGSIKMHADHATIYQIPAGANDANAGKYSHMVLTGTQAHMQQVHDGDCSVMTADANTIDYKPLTHIAELTGAVKVVQAGRGESHSEHMIYNTDTGDMESGDNSPGSRVKLTMEPKAAQPAVASTNNCGFPGGQAAKAANKPAAAKNDKH